MADDELRRLWRRAASKEPSFSGDEVIEWPHGLRESWVQLGILEETDFATVLPCPFCGPYERQARVDITLDTNGKLVAAVARCDEQGREKPIENLDRVRGWRVNLGALVRCLAAALGFSSPPEVRHVDRWYRLGRRASANRERLVFVARGMDWHNDPTSHRDYLTAISTAGGLDVAIVMLGDAPTQDEVVGWYGVEPKQLDQAKLPTFLAANELVRWNGKQIAAVVPSPLLPSPLEPTAQELQGKVGTLVDRVPRGTRWEQVRVVLAGDKLTIHVEGVASPITMTFEEAGFRDLRKTTETRPLRHWIWLGVFAAAGCYRARWLKES